MLNKTFLDAITGSQWTLVEEVTEDPWNGLNTLLYRFTCSDTHVPDRYLSPAGLQDLLKIGMLREV